MLTSCIVLIFTFCFQNGHEQVLWKFTAELVQDNIHTRAAAILYQMSFCCLAITSTLIAKIYLIFNLSLYSVLLF